MRKGASSPRDLAEQHAAAAGMLSRAQRLIDDGLLLAALVVAEADGKDRIVDRERSVAIARGMLVDGQNAKQASYIFDSPITDGGEITPAGIVRAISDPWMD